MALRVSGKRALIRIQPTAGSDFDASGVSSNGEARANQFGFQIAATVVDADGYNQPYTQPIPVGQSKVNGSMTLFYNNATGEANAVLNTLYAAQHAPDDCDDPSAYTLEIMPEGDCSGKELWYITAFVVENLDFQTPFDGLMVITFNWRGFTAARCIPPASVTIAGEDEVDEGDTESYTTTILPVTHTDVTIVWSPTPDSGQGTTSATYTFNTAGTTTLTVTVTDACQRTVTDTLDVTVNPGA
jgi:hypothetical protein